MINTDKQRVMQVLLCLQSNALKFTHDGSVEIIVEIRQIFDDMHLFITVKDTGIGISTENQSKLFKFFGFLKESEEMNTSGVGLGLVISRQIARQFDGDISVESQPGIGSEFTFSFKLNPPN
jgi:signal transduction histidine kinase